jgi:urease accessory protein
MTVQFKPVLPSGRRWQGRLNLDFALRGGITRLVGNSHYGPLRVLKPFYPESDCCHAYLLHPPGGLVLGDELLIEAKVHPGGHALLTTPSAGKVYGVNNAAEKQRQSVSLEVSENACVEWFPQETLVFNGANAALHTDVNLQKGARVALWDVVCFGCPASQLAFNSGECLQSIRVLQQGRPLLIERNHIQGGGILQRSAWGLDGCNSLGTYIMTLATTREHRQHLTAMLENTALEGSKQQWGLTQKNELFIARYLGDSASHCRRGFEYLWHELRPLMLKKVAVAPRIWST